MHKNSKYVLFLDDDVRLHPGTIGALTAEMEKNPDVCYYPLRVISCVNVYIWTMYCFNNSILCLTLVNTVCRYLSKLVTLLIYLRGV